MSSPPKDSKDEIPNTKETEKEEAPKPKSEESGDEGEEMVARFVTLAMMPTLRYFYKTKRLQPASEPKDVRYPCKPSLLDRVSLYQGDITKLQVDAIVNAANRSLLGGGGVDGAIHSAAGDELYEECLTLGGADTGEAKITGGHRLPAKHVIHAVGPVYSSSHRDIKAEQLASCYSTSLGLALSNNLTSIAFCSLSTGIYGYPIVAATHIALRTTREFLDNVEKADSIERVIFVVWSDKDKHVYEYVVSLSYDLRDLPIFQGLNPAIFPHREEANDAEPASPTPKDEESVVPMEESQKS